MASAHGTAIAAPIQPTPAARARDWAEIQERTLVPLYEAVHQRLAVGPALSLLDLGCRSGLALLLAAGRGAQVAGLEPDPELRELARARRLPVAPGPGATRSAHGAVTVFEPLRLAEEPRRVAREAARLVLPGGLVVLAGLAPEQACQSAAVLEVARRRGGPGRLLDPFRLSGAGELAGLAAGAGLRVVGSGQVACPFGYPDLDSAVRGLLATGWFDAALAYAGAAPVAKEVAEALHPFTRADDTVRMANVFQYVLGRRT
ncbi:class I SAM-dependent methyltransferase [Kitasatospora sp. NBC_01287]|uniref:class I SAM-dependent methyltransferase n=1 Tax=Kitasatospora sp. NBC_01287 TaxID=2903573 RepID=UPI00224F68B8|nr:methyltransferase domain-containing protein [Kitasatospora sp. NBC_01287]MCX4746567.1 class I SAM-dependent methyltransferase [Kitasatospora sp. NBC_01287]